MLIGLMYFITRVVIPHIFTYATALVKPIMVIVITLAGIVMLFGAVGFKISTGLGSTVVHGIFHAIGATVRAIIRAAKWLFRLIPRAYKASRKFFLGLGLGAPLSTLIAALITLLII